MGYRYAPLTPEMIDSAHDSSRLFAGGLVISYAERDAAKLARVLEETMARHGVGYEYRFATATVYRTHVEANLYTGAKGESVRWTLTLGLTPSCRMGHSPFAPEDEEKHLQIMQEVIEELGWEWRK